ncbi:MAG TPA: RNA polymerase sigma factor [Candidatus Limnocylindria bacterium]|nr:RNA polymerase sigma factor [Candidatus Limnocylindria bacterium]
MHLPPFQTLVDAHAAELHRFLTVLVGPHDADDCLQEALLSALRAYARLTSGENLRAWLYTIAQRKALDLGRRRARRRTEALDGLDGRREPAAWSPDPADDGLWREVGALPPKQRAAIVHRFVFDLPYAEVASRMGCTEEAARQSVRAGLTKLRGRVTR